MRAAEAARGAVLGRDPNNVYDNRAQNRAQAQTEQDAETENTKRAQAQVSTQHAGVAPWASRSKSSALSSRISVTERECKAGEGKYEGDDSRNEQREGRCARDRFSVQRCPEVATEARLETCES